MRDRCYQKVLNTGSEKIYEHFPATKNGQSLVVTRENLAGRMPDAGAINDRLICSCFSVGLAAITTAISEQKAVTAADIGRVLQAGTGCGSCLPEIKEILDDVLPRAAE